MSFYTTLPKSSNDANSEIHGARYGRVWISTEPERNEKIYCSKLKAITGGDKMTTRANYDRIKQEWTPQATVLIQTNGIPGFTDNMAKSAMVERTRILKFQNEFIDNPDPSKPWQKLGNPIIKKKSTSDPNWRDAFIIMLMLYYIESIIPNQSPSIPMSQFVKETTKEAIQRQNPLFEWLYEVVEPTREPDAGIEFNELYQIALQDGATTNERPFKKALIEMGLDIESKRTMIDGIRKQITIIKNICFKMG
jgi:phage/plasmid-associated DNA primase